MPARRHADPPALDPRLDDLPFQRRFREAAEAKGVTTVRQLARLPPESLVSVKRSTMVDEARAILERFFGHTWEELLVMEKLPEAVSIATPTTWDELRFSLSADLRAVRLEALVLPSIMQTVIERQGIRTLGELAQRSEAQLSAEPRLGRLTVRRTFVAVTRFVRAFVPAPVEGPGLLDLWKMRLDHLTPRQREVIRLRAGLDGPALGIHAAALRMGLSRSAASTFQVAGVERIARDYAWMAEVRARFLAGLPWPGVALATLAKDPWWKEMAALPRALSFFSKTVLQEASVLDIGGELYLVRWSRPTQH
jgi:hypothetical protein